MVSIPIDRGTTSSRSTSLTSPLRTPPWIAADGHNLVGIHTLVGFFAEDLFYLILDSGDACGTAHQNHLVDLRSGKAGILLEPAHRELRLHR